MDSEGRGRFPCRHSAPPSAQETPFEHSLLPRSTGVEKYLKARLEEAGLSVPKTHDLLHLLNLVLPAEPLWSSYQSAFSLLVSYAVQTRYPGNSVTKSDARHAMKLCREFRKEARGALGLR
jgi:HEPN domain-containing protein